MSGIIQKYHQYLPIDEQHIVTLHEGNTPLLPVPRLRDAICPKLAQLYLKLEGLNPTGSFKDRGMTYAVSKAVAQGSKAIICASTGNTSAAAAAYAARAGIKAYVLIPKGKIALGKLSQAMIHGAKVIAINGNFDDALKIVLQIAAQGGATLVNSVNPDRLEGQKTAAFEICDVLGSAPTHHMIPVGNAGNITAYWKGYCEYFREGKITSRPRMMGFQAAGSAPIVDGKIIKHPKTIATAIMIGNPASWKASLAARDESEGLIDKVTDREILKAYKMIACLEGYFCEPSSAAGVAGLIKYAERGYFSKGDVVVCTLTGHGLKDPDRAIEVSAKLQTVRPTLKEVLKVLKI